jgi:hypothetical protein
LFELKLQAGHFPACSFLGRGRNYFTARQVMSIFTGISLLIGIVRNEGRSILKSEQVAGTVPAIFTSEPLTVS